MKLEDMIRYTILIVSVRINGLFYFLFFYVVVCVLGTTQVVIFRF